MGKHRKPNRPACGCGEGYYVKLIAGARQEVLAPAVHDCQYIKDRNGCLRVAEMRASAVFPKPIRKKDLPAWNARWTAFFLGTVDLLYTNLCAERAGRVEKQTAPDVLAALGLSGLTR